MMCEIFQNHDFPWVISTVGFCWGPGLIGAYQVVHVVAQLN